MYLFYYIIIIYIIYNVIYVFNKIKNKDVRRVQSFKTRSISFCLVLETS